MSCFMDMEPLNGEKCFFFEKLSSIYFNHEWRISDFYENSVIHLFLSTSAFCFFTELCATILMMKSFFF